jgi:hypothetical protein
MPDENTINASLRRVYLRSAMMIRIHLKSHGHSIPIYYYFYFPYLTALLSIGFQLLKSQTIRELSTTNYSRKKNGIHQ